jgi:hypothetical protein
MWGQKDDDSCDDVNSLMSDYFYDEENDIDHESMFISTWPHIPRLCESLILSQGRMGPLPSTVHYARSSYLVKTV